MRIEVFVRDKNNVLLGKCQNWKSLHILKKHNAVSTWVLETTNFDTAYSLLRDSANKIYIEITTDSGTKKELLSGFITNIMLSQSDQIDLTVNGISDETILFDHLAFPCEYPFTAQANDSQTGKAETVMKHFVNQLNQTANRFGSGITPLQIEVDRGKGNAVIASARFDVLGELLQSLAISGGNLGFKIENNTFCVFEQVDRRSEQVFSFAARNILTLSYEQIMPTTTMALVAGQGEGVDRVFRRTFSSASTTRTTESFVDRRDLSDAGELQQVANEAILTNATQKVLKASVIDRPYRSYIDNYDLGNLVTIEGVEGSIAEIEIKVDGDGITISPTIVTSPTVDISSFNTKQKMQAINKRLHVIERSK